MNSVEPFAVVVGVEETAGAVHRIEVIVVLRIECESAREIEELRPALAVDRAKSKAAGADGECGGGTARMRIDSFDGLVDRHSRPRQTGVLTVIHDAVRAHGPHDCGVTRVDVDRPRAAWPRAPGDTAVRGEEDRVGRGDVGDELVRWRDRECMNVGAY